MATLSIDFNKVIKYSKLNCVQKSISKCAAYVKNAFKEGGCKYVSGDGWDNQRFCRENDFKCIGDFVPVDNNPRPHSGKKIQFPAGYTQQVGDICLIKHGKYGHICYATGTGIDDWVSDYWQKAPGQMNGTGPYCYTDNYERIQFWRHSSVMNTTPEVFASPINEPTYEIAIPPQKVNNPMKVSPQRIENMKAPQKTINNNFGIILGAHLNQK